MCPRIWKYMPVIPRGACLWGLQQGGPTQRWAGGGWHCCRFPSFLAVSIIWASQNALDTASHSLLRSRLSWDGEGADWSGCLEGAPQRALFFPSVWDLEFGDPEDSFSLQNGPFPSAIFFSHLFSFQIESYFFHNRPHFFAISEIPVSLSTVLWGYHRF